MAFKEIGLKVSQTGRGGGRGGRGMKYTTQYSTQLSFNIIWLTLFRQTARWLTNFWSLSICSQQICEQQEKDGLQKTNKGGGGQDGAF